MRIKHDPSTSDISTSCPPLACDAADFRAPGGSARLDYLCIYRANFADALRHAAFVEVTRNRPTRSVGYAPTLFILKEIHGPLMVAGTFLNRPRHAARW
jgi:hypothetical protein